TYDDLGRLRRVTVRDARVDGRSADFLHRDGELLVALGRTLALGDAVEVEVAYDGELAERPSGHSYWLLGTWPWYPRRELAGELATMEIEVDVPEALTPFASGAEIARTAEGGRRRLVTRLERPMQFAVVTAGKYKVIEETREGVTCRAATYALLKEKAARELIEKFFSSRVLFEELFDVPYPFRNFSIVEINSWGFGQAPPGILFLTKEFYTAPVERRTRVFFQGLQERFLHEVAHGWWGHVAKMDSLEESWLIEAFADYTAAIALWRLRGGEPGVSAFDRIVREWVAAAAELGPGASLYLSSRLALDDDRNREDFWRLWYAKGPLVVHALRLELQRQKGSAEEGDRYFIALLRSYLKRNPYGWGTTQGLVATLDELTGGDWQPWFERYVHGTEIPRLPK
ncbi:MAG: M1 family metallopeptidase, partial [Thermoanaerobaculia bacterium]